MRSVITGTLEKRTLGGITEGVNGVNCLTKKAFFCYRKRINYKIFTDKRIKVCDFLSVYGAK